MRHTHKYGKDFAGPPACRRGAAVPPGNLFVKTDKPRQIDPYIDYFGDAALAAPAPRLENGARWLMSHAGRL